MNCKTLWVVVGCYDGSLHGWRSSSILDGKEENMISELIEEPDLAFAYSAHRNCIKCVDIRKPQLSKKAKSFYPMATGSTDESVKIYDLARAKEVGDITEHSNIVTAVKFVGNKFLLSGCSDGRVLLWRVNDWQMIHEFKGHKDGPVEGFAVHPTNNLFLSISRDNSLRLWDLLHYKAASRSKIEEVKEIQLLEFNAEGDKYFLVCDYKKLMCFNVSNETGTPDFSFQSNSRINSISVVSSFVVAFGTESGSVFFYDFESKKIVKEINCIEAEDPETRVKVRFIEHLKVDDKSLLLVCLSSNKVLIYLNPLKEEASSPDKVLNIGSKAHPTGFSAMLFSTPLDTNELKEGSKRKNSQLDSPQKANGKKAKQ